MNEIQTVINKQREFFKTGKTLDVSFRIESLKKLYAAIKKFEPKLNEAIQADLAKSPFETYMCEIGLSLAEITHLIKHTKRYAKPKGVHTPLAQFLSKSFVLPSPYGNTLIMSPWNYPFMLAIEPLADAIAAGNTAILKPSELSPHVSEVLKEMIEETFKEDYIAVINGGVDTATELLNQKFDFIFFTGSTKIGKIVLESTVKNLTPCVLELGGKSPCIIDKSADLKLTARRIAFGKFLNAGQTCVAPDYILIDESVQDSFLSLLKEEIEKQYGPKPLENKDYVKIISKKHYDRLLSLISKDKVVIGGQGDESTLKIEPTVMKDVTLDDTVMNQEIFGPILPVISYKDFNEVYQFIDKHPTPLALYIFSKDKKTIKKVLKTISFGGGCVNDVVIHLANSEMGFGGVGNSGMGSYHGKAGFDAFSHYKSIVDKKLVIDLPMRYQPYKSKLYDKMIHFSLK